MTTGPASPSAAAPSPFPPIAEYAFLSDCRTGALVAPNGSVDWLCVPRFDAPSVFGSLLDRQGGYFRFKPFGINHPTERFYDPGTNVLVTTWKTPSGWVIVRDALTIGPWSREDTVTPHTRPPADDDADHTADATAAGVTIRLRTDLGIGVEGGTVRARHTLEEGERAYCALSWAEGATRRRTPTRRPPGSPPQLSTGAGGWGARASPTTVCGRPSSAPALTIKGLTFMPTGATSRRSRRRCRRRRAGSATGTTGTPGSATPHSRSRPSTG